MKTAQADVETLIGCLFPKLKKTLKLNQGFETFGAILDEAGKQKLVSIPDGDLKKGTDHVIRILEENLARLASDGKCKAAAIVSDIITIPPGKRKKQDAISFALDHRDNYSIIVIFPYSIDKSGELKIEELFAIDGEKKIFPKKIAAGKKLKSSPKKSSKKPSK